MSRKYVLAAGAAALGAAAMGRRAEQYGPPEQPWHERRVREVGPHYKQKGDGKWRKTSPGRYAKWLSGSYPDMPDQKGFGYGPRLFMQKEVKGKKRSWFVHGPGFSGHLSASLTPAEAMRGADKELKLARIDLVGKEEEARIRQGQRSRRIWLGMQGLPAQGLRAPKKRVLTRRKVLVQQVSAGYTNMGNRRAGFFVYSPKGDFLGFIERYRGHGGDVKPLFPNYTLLPGVNVQVSEITRAKRAYRLPQNWDQFNVFGS